MLEAAIATAYHRYRPGTGWLPLILLLMLLSVLVGATVDVAWVPQVRVVIPAAFGGFFLAYFLARRAQHAVAAWVMLVAIGVILTTLALGRFIPDTAVRAMPDFSWAGYLLQRLQLFFDRLSGWAATVAGGEPSTETLAFAAGLALVAWLVGAFLAWSVFRWGQVLPGLTVAGAALALNNYFGQAPMYWPVSFIGLAILLTALLNYAGLEQDWDRRGIDFPGEVRSELLVAAAFVSLLLMSIALALPSINIQAIAAAFQRQPAVVEAELALERAFAGVEQPRLDDASAVGAVSQPAGILPRAFLLSAAPDLLASPVMTATILADDPLPELARWHWRGASYDTYTGRGWQRSTEQAINVRAGEPIPSQPGAAILTTEPVFVRQHVTWVDSPLLTRYSRGFPVQFDHPVVTYWLAEDEFVRASARSANLQSYEVTSRLTTLDEDLLRSATLEEVPASLRARYTELPDSVTQRVHDLAYEVANGPPGSEAALSPYDQALAIQQFLRQYPYSLDVGLPPASVDMTDYFLFDLQRGFCDYYATAMVVMARSVGLPARLATGFLPQPPDEAGVETIRQVDAHSWAEIYLAGFGWIEFEPTPAVGGAVPASGQDVPAAYDAGVTPPSGVSAPVALPSRAPQRDIPWPLLIVAGLLSAIVSVAFGRWLRQRRQQQPGRLDDVEAAYATLQREAALIGLPQQSGQTPLEFAAQLSALLEQRYAVLAPATPSPQPQVWRLASIYTEHQYRERSRQADLGMRQEARRLALEIRHMFRQLRLRRLLATLRRP